MITNKSCLIDNIIGIRGILFLLIFGTHFKYIIKDSSIGKLLYDTLDNGGFAVLFFFLLSGFCMSLGYSDKFMDINLQKYKSYIKKRLIKFYPLYIITGLISLLFTNLSHSFSYIYAFIFLYVPMIFPWTKYLNGGGNGAAWFLASLFFCYLLTPNMSMLLNKIKNKKTNVMLCGISYILLLLIGALLLIFHVENSEYFYKIPLIRIIQYFIGFNLGIIYKECFMNRINILTRNSIIINLFDIIFIAIVLCLMISPFSHSLFYRNLICLPVISIFILYLCIPGKRLLQVLLNNKIICFLSHISFECYLIHYIVMELLKPYCLNYINTVNGVLYIFILLLFITTLLSYTYKKFYNFVCRCFNF